MSEIYNYPCNDVPPRTMMALNLFNMIVVAETKFGGRREYSPLNLVFLFPRDLVFLMVVALEIDGLSDYVSEHEPVAQIEAKSFRHDALGRFDGYVSIHGTNLPFLMADTEEAILVPHQLIGHYIKDGAK